MKKEEKGNDAIENQAKTIYELDLHESCKVNPQGIAIRVPGGWIYQHYKSNLRNEFLDEPFATTFVPWARASF